MLVLSTLPGTNCGDPPGVKGARTNQIKNDAIKGIGLKKLIKRCALLGVCCRILQHKHGRRWPTMIDTSPESVNRVSTHMRVSNHDRTGPEQF